MIFYSHLNVLCFLCGHLCIKMCDRVMKVDLDGCESFTEDGKNLPLSIWCYLRKAFFILKCCRYTNWRQSGLDCLARGPSYAAKYWSSYL